MQLLSPVRTFYFVRYVCPSLDSPPPPVAGTHYFDIGDRVFVCGLVNRSDLNGMVGEVLQPMQLKSEDSKRGDGRVEVMMSSSKGKARENVRIKPENLRLYSRKIAYDRAVHPGIRCVIRHHTKSHDRLVVEVVSYDHRNERCDKLALAPPEVRASHSSALPPLPPQCHCACSVPQS